MFSEYDVVKAARAIDDIVPEGTTGAILMIFNDAKTREYEVEFVDDAGESLAVLTVPEGDLILVET